MFGLFESKKKKDASGPQKEERGPSLTSGDPDARASALRSAYDPQEAAAQDLLPTAASQETSKPSVASEQANRPGTRPKKNALNFTPDSSGPVIELEEAIPVLEGSFSCFRDLSTVFEISMTYASVHDISSHT